MANQTPDLADIKARLTNVRKVLQQKFDNPNDKG